MGAKVVVALHRKTWLRPEAPTLEAVVVVASCRKTSLRHVALTATSLCLALARAQWWLARYAWVPPSTPPCLYQGLLRPP